MFKIFYKILVMYTFALQPIIATKKLTLQNFTPLNILKLNVAHNLLLYAILLIPNFFVLLNSVCVFALSIS